MRGRGMPGPFSRFFVQTLWPRLEEPVAEILVHLAVTILSVLSIAIIELLLRMIRLDEKIIPGTALALHHVGLEGGITLSDWMLVLEVIAATAIIAIGIGKAIYVLVRS